MDPWKTTKADIGEAKKEQNTKSPPPESTSEKNSDGHLRAPEHTNTFLPKIRFFDSERKHVEL
jgi:hypothetical protein